MYYTRKRKVESFLKSNKKKGNAVLDTLTILVIIVTFAMISIMGMKIFSDVDTEIQTNNEMGTEAKNISGDLYDKYPRLLDNMILFAFVLLVAFTIISVFMLDTHPIFFILTVIMLLSVFIVAMLLGNSYNDVMQEDDFSPYANQFTYTTWLMTHILQLMIAVGFIVAITLFIKFRAIT